MDAQLWELQQAAEQRVERMREQSRRIAEQQERRTAASLRAARPPLTAPQRMPAPLPGRSVRSVVPAVAPTREPDPERQMLLLLTLLLARSGASADLLLILLYLAL